MLWPPFSALGAGLGPHHSLPLCHHFLPTLPSLLAHSAAKLLVTQAWAWQVMRGLGFLGPITLPLAAPRPGYPNPNPNPTPNPDSNHSGLRTPAAMGQPASDPLPVAGSLEKVRSC